MLPALKVRKIACPVAKAQARPSGRSLKASERNRRLFRVVIATGTGKTRAALP